MLLWFAGGSFLAVWLVFRDPAIDHRLVMAGAVVPDLIDVWTGGPWLGHTVLANVVLLCGIMLATTGRRLLRRQLLAVPIGTFLHLVLDGAWTDAATFWWPVFGSGLGDGGVPSVERGLWNLPLELVGLGILVWAYGRFRLDEAPRRAHFVTTGRLGRDLVG